MKHWYAAHTHSKSELRASVNLKRQDLEVYFPQIRFSMRQSKFIKDSIKPLFPRYVFVAIDLAKQNMICFEICFLKKMKGQVKIMMF